MSDTKLGELPRCTSEHRKQEWPYSARCVLDENHWGRMHEDISGHEWIEEHWEIWFRLMWNAGIAILEFLPEEATNPGTPWFDMMETMHGIAEDQPWLFDARGWVRKIEDGGARG